MESRRMNPDNTGIAMELARLQTILDGEVLGFYEALRRHGPATVAELVIRTGASLEDARLWVAAQVAAGLVQGSESGVPLSDRRYQLREGLGELLVDLEHPLDRAPATPVNHLSEDSKFKGGVI